MLDKFPPLLVLAVGAAGMLTTSAQASIGGAGAAALSAQVAPIEKAQVFGGRRYCWDRGGWRGAGWYWCGYGARRGMGWGGGMGWHGWRAPNAMSLHPRTESGGPGARQGIGGKNANSPSPNGS